MNLYSLIGLLIFFLIIITFDTLKIMGKTIYEGNDKFVNSNFLEEKNNSKFQFSAFSRFFSIEVILFLIFLLKMQYNFEYLILLIFLLIIIAFISINKRKLSRIRNITKKKNSEISGIYYSTLYSYGKMVFLTFIIYQFLNSRFAYYSQGLFVITVLMIGFCLIFGGIKLNEYNNKIASFFVLAALILGAINKDIEINSVVNFFETILNNNFFANTNSLIAPFLFVTLISLAYGAWLMGVEKELRFKERSSLNFKGNLLKLILKLFLIIIFLFFFFNYDVKFDIEMSFLLNIKNFGNGVYVEAIYLVAIVASFFVIVSDMLSKLAISFNINIFQKQNIVDTNKQTLATKVFILWNILILSFLVSIIKYLTSELAIFLIALNVNTILFLGIYYILISYSNNKIYASFYEKHNLILLSLVFLGATKTLLERVFGIVFMSNEYILQTIYWLGYTIGLYSIAVIFYYFAKKKIIVEFAKKNK